MIINVEFKSLMNPEDVCYGIKGKVWHESIEWQKSDYGQCSCVVLLSMLGYCKP